MTRLLTPPVCHDIDYEKGAHIPFLTTFINMMHVHVND